MGLTHLSKYLTVGDVFFEIERRWVNSQIRTPDERRDYQFTKILNNDDLLIVFFGDDQDFLKQVKKFYAETRHLVPTSIPQNMNDSSGGEDVTGNDDDSDDSNDESNNDGKEAPDDEEEQEEEGDENKEQESSNGGEEGKEEKKREAQGQQVSKKKEKDRKEGSTEQFVEESPDKIQQHTMSEIFKSIDHGM
jgi:cobalamin biosynthesis protein CobT